MRLFNDFVGKAEHSWRNVEAECLGGLQVDHQLEFGRLQHRHIGWPLPLEDTAGINAGLAKCVRYAGAVADQATRPGECANAVQGRHRVPCCERDDSPALRSKERSMDHDDRIGPLSGKGGKTADELAFRAGLDNLNSPTQRARCIVQVAQLGRAIWTVRVHERADGGHSLKQVAKQPEPRPLQRDLQKAPPRGIAAGTVVAGQRPSLTGSVPVTNTTGIVAVTDFAAIATGVFPTMTAI